VKDKLKLERSRVNMRIRERKYIHVRVYNAQKDFNFKRFVRKLYQRFVPQRYDTNETASCISQSCNAAQTLGFPFFNRNLFNVNAV